MGPYSNPCQQINDFRSGLLKVAITRDADGVLVRKAGIMTVVERGGTVVPGDAIRVELPARPHIPLDRV
jgi:MOSC domain-containing protein YiiM